MSSAGTIALDNIMTTTTYTNNSLPSPAASIITLDLTLLFTPIPSGPLTDQSRVQLQEELEQIRKSSSESQNAYNVAHASIPAYQELVLTTHAQVAAAKQALLRAKGITSTGSSSTSITSSASTSNASSPPSPSSPLNNHLHQQQQLAGAVDAHKRDLHQLEQEHVNLGLKLSQVLRDKAEAEETKKRLNDYMLRAKTRIREIESKLCE